MTAVAAQRSWWSRVWDGLKRIQQRISIAMTIALLFALYWTVVAVVAIAARLAGKDLLHPQRPEPGSHWLHRPPIDRTLAQYRQQF